MARAVYQRLVSLPGTWYQGSGQSGDGSLHFFPNEDAGTLCGMGVGKWQGASSRSEAYCVECSDERTRRELEA